jgi:hypothetical protein
MICFSSHAIEREGGGGDAIVCYDRPLYLENGNINPNARIALKPLLKDYWEMEETMGALDLSLGNENLSYKEKVHFVLNRLGTVDKERAARLKERFEDKTFYNLASRSRIPDIDDATTLLKPRESENCYDVQVAIQRFRQRPFQSKVIIDENIFSLMDEDHKAGLILHELLYEEEIKHVGARTSDKARWYNAIVSSDYISNLDDINLGVSWKYNQLILQYKLSYSTSYNYKSFLSNFFTNNFLVKTLKVTNNSFLYKDTKFYFGDIPGVQGLENIDIIAQGGYSSAIFLKGKSNNVAGLSLNLVEEIESLSIKIDQIQLRLEKISQVVITEGHKEFNIGFEFKSGLFQGEAENLINISPLIGITFTIDFITGELLKIHPLYNDKSNAFKANNISFKRISSSIVTKINGNWKLDSIKAKKIEFYKTTIEKECFNIQNDVYCKPIEFQFNSDHTSLGKIKREYLKNKVKTNFKLKLGKYFKELRFLYSGRLSSITY